MESLDSQTKMILRSTAIQAIAAEDTERKDETTSINKDHMATNWIEEIEANQNMLHSTPNSSFTEETTLASGISLTKDDKFMSRTEKINQKVDIVERLLKINERVLPAELVTFSQKYCTFLKDLRVASCVCECSCTQQSAMPSENLLGCFLSLDVEQLILNTSVVRLKNTISDDCPDGSTSDLTRLFDIMGCHGNNAPEFVPMATMLMVVLMLMYMFMYF
jgi:hypothetical protein